MGTTSTRAWALSVFGATAAAFALFGACSLDTEQFTFGAADGGTTTSSTGGGSSSGGSAGSTTAATGGAGTAGAGGANTGAGGATGIDGSVTDGSADTPLPTSCEAGTTSCLNGTTRLTCSPAGQPMTEPCVDPKPVCANGDCVVCKSGDTRCSGKDVQTCGAAGWTTSQTCDIGCALPGNCLTVTSLAAGVAHTCAALSDGTVRCWGYRGLALRFVDAIKTPPASSSDYVVAPTPIDGITDAVEVDTGDAHTCARTRTGTIKCWGWNGVGQFGNGTVESSQTAVAGPPLTGVKQIDAAIGSTCAILTNGQLNCWGFNDQGEQGNGMTGTQPVDPHVITLPFPAATVRAYNEHVCAALTSKDAACWGGNLYGQVGIANMPKVPTPNGVGGDGVLEITAGGGHSCLRYEMGGVSCWGQNNQGQLGINNPTVLSAPAPTAVSGLTSVTALALGGYHSCAIHSGKKLACWGYNDMGQLGMGDGAPANVLSPTQVPQLIDVEKVTLGEKHTCVIRTDASVYCWGINNDGQLGIGALGGHNTPQKVRW